MLLLGTGGFFQAIRFLIFLRWKDLLARVLLYIGIGECGRNMCTDLNQELKDHNMVPQLQSQFFQDLPLKKQFYPKYRY